ncbi:MAG TPA: LUD domain-containing protein [Jatrophihabitantaceae bacterium]|jgi:L-lactate dehydrogenase complex protein LldG
MTATARAEILTRIRAAQAAEPADVTIPRDYHGPGTLPVTGASDLLVERLQDYGAIVRRCSAQQVPLAIAEVLEAHGARRIVTPIGLPSGWADAVPEPVPEAGRLATPDLDAADGALTSVTVAIAQTGTLVLDQRPGQGQRSLTLVPDLHVAVVAADRIIAAVPDAVAAVDPSRPQTWISGPSATSDIELNRVEGVHGPRTLVVIVIDA